MDKPSTSGLPQKPSTGRRVRLIPATPRPEGIALPTSQSVAVPNEGTSQPPETFGGDLYSRIIKEAMAKLNRDEIKEGKTSSSESSSKAATLSGTRSDPTSSLSLRFSNGETFEEVASEVIREMREVEKREEDTETRGAREPLQVPAEAANRGTQENPIRDFYDLTETDDEEVAASDDWKRKMEETVAMLVIENAEQNTMLKAQREQMTKMVDIVDRMIFCLDGGPQSSHQLSPAVSAVGQNEPPQNVLDTNLAGTSRKRKPTTNPPPSRLPASDEAKRHKLKKRSGFHGSQKKN